MTNCDVCRAEEAGDRCENCGNMFCSEHAGPCREYMGCLCDPCHGGCMCR